MSPLEFMQRLPALVPRLRLPLIRFHGGLASNAKLRALVMPQGPPANEEAATEAVVAAECEVGTVQVRPHRMGWARLLKRVFDIDMQHCPNCGTGQLKIIAAMLERPVMTLLNSDRSGDPVTRAAGIGCVRGFAGPREAGSRSGITRRMRRRKTTVGGAVEAQQSSATFKDQLRRVKAPFWGVMRRKIGAFENLMLIGLCCRSGRRTSA
jgi:hypothetical protein